MARLSPFGILAVVGVGAIFVCLAIEGIAAFPGHHRKPYVLHHYQNHSPPHHPSPQHSQDDLHDDPNPYSFSQEGQSWSSSSSASREVGQNQEDDNSFEYVLSRPLMAILPPSSNSSTISSSRNANDTGVTEVIGNRRLQAADDDYDYDDYFYRNNEEDSTRSLSLLTNSSSPSSVVDESSLNSPVLTNLMTALNQIQKGDTEEEAAMSFLIKLDVEGEFEGVDSETAQTVMRWSAITLAEEANLLDANERAIKKMTTKDILEALKNHLRHIE